MSTYPKPDHLHKLQSTRPQSKASTTGTPPAGRPKFPAGISGRAKYIFRQLIKTLESRRTLTPGDGQLLALYAANFDRHERALAKLAEQGEICVYTRLDSNGTAHDVEKPNLWLKVAENSERFMLSALDRLGLTPLAKGKVLPSAPVDEIVPGSLADLLRQQSAAPAPATKRVPESIPDDDLDELLKQEFLN